MFSQVRLGQPRIGLIIASTLLVAACSSSQDTGADSNQVPTKNVKITNAAARNFQRSTVCTNFFGAYQKDMAVTGAQVTMKFCPEATKYKLKWANEDPILTEIESANTAEVITGSEFITKGPLEVEVFRYFRGMEPYEEDESFSKYMLLGKFRLEIRDIDGKKMLKGIWEGEQYHDALVAHQFYKPFSVYDTTYFVSYLLETLYWYQRDRCRVTTSPLESEAFNLEFDFVPNISFGTRRITSWIGRAAIVAKNANAPLSDRRAGFRAFNLFQQSISEFADVVNGSLITDETCSAPINDESLSVPLSDAEQKKLADAAPVLRKAALAVEKMLCTTPYVRAWPEELSAYTALDIPPWHWRSSAEKDKGALEVAAMRLKLLALQAPPLVDVANFYGCPRTQWGQNFWTSQELDAYFNPPSIPAVSEQPATEPTVVTQLDPPTDATTTVPTTGVTAQTENSVSQQSDNSATPAPQTAVSAVTPRQSLLTVGGKASLRSIASYAGLKISKGAQVSVKIQKSSAKNCKATRTAVLAQRQGQCAMKVSIVQKKKTLTSATLRLNVSAR